MNSSFTPSSIAHSPFAQRMRGTAGCPPCRVALAMLKATIRRGPELSEIPLDKETEVSVERMRELRRRRSRKKKLAILKRKATVANASEKAAIAMKLRKLTPGAQEVIGAIGLEER
jgi:hypothetical protein